MENSYKQIFTELFFKVFPNKDVIVVPIPEKDFMLINHFTLTVCGKELRLSSRLHLIIVKNSRGKLEFRYANSPPPVSHEQYLVNYENFKEIVCRSLNINSSEKSYLYYIIQEQDLNLLIKINPELFFPYERIPGSDLFKLTDSGIALIIQNGSEKQIKLLKALNINV